MKHDLIILESDKEYARQRIAQLDAQILALGPEFRKAFTQTSETWHDNAPFEVVRDNQTLLAAERHHLKQILHSSSLTVPKQKKSVAGIGSRVTLKNVETGKPTVYFIAGDWTPNAGQIIDGVTVMSRRSPIAVEIIGKKIGDTVKFNNEFIIVSIDY